MIPSDLVVPPPLGALLESSWQAVVLVFAVCTAQRVLGKHLTAGWRHALWWIVLVRLLLPTTPPSPWSLFNLMPTPTRPSASAVDGRWFEPPPAPSPDDRVPVHSVHPVQVVHDVQPPTPAPLPIPNQPQPPAPGSLLLPLWLAGVAIVLLRLLLQITRFSRRLRTEMTPGSPERLALLDHCRTEMKVARPVRLLEGTALTSPALIGWIRPTLLLPSSVASTWSSAQLRHVFLHELAHLRRGDLWVNALLQILHALHWFNPVVAWSFRCLRADRELATDALVLRITGAREARAYGRTILRLLEDWTQPIPQPTAVAMIANPASLERRIRAISEYRKPSGWTPLTGLLLAALAAVSWTGPQLAPAQDEQPPTRTLVAGKPIHDDAHSPSDSPPIADGTPSVDPTKTVQEAPNPAPRNPFARGNPVRTSKEREAIQSKLKGIRLEALSLNRLSLSKVIRFLNEVAKLQDPEHHGVNFLINPYLEPARAESLATVDPNTGALIPAVELPEVTIHIDPPIHDLRLSDALDAICRAASRPIKYTVEDYAVVFIDGRAPTLFTRIFRVDPETYSRAMAAVSGIPSRDEAEVPVSSPAPSLQEKTRRFLEAAGVNLRPPNAVFFNHRKGLLMVRATQEEIEIVEQALKVLQPSKDEPTPSPGARPAPADSDSAGTESPSNPAAAPQDAVQRNLVIPAEGPMLIEGEPPIGDSELASRLQDLARRHPNANLVLLSSDNVELGRVVNVMYLAKGAGLKRVELKRFIGSQVPTPWTPVWRSASDLITHPPAEDHPILIAFEADWCLVGVQTRKRILDSDPVIARLQETGTDLYRVDCTQSGPEEQALRTKYGIKDLPGYAIFQPDRKAWSVLSSSLTTQSLLDALAPANGAPR